MNIVLNVEPAHKFSTDPIFLEVISIIATSNVDSMFMAMALYREM